MPHYICLTCGVQYAESSQPPEHCLICEDDRQYIGWNGQQWTTLSELQQKYANRFMPIEPGLNAFKTTPDFAIGQRAHVIQTPHGNVLWETVSLIDEATIKTLRDSGGIQAIAISHPHFYDSMVEWSHALGGVPIYLHRSNQPWVMRPDPVIHYWDGDTFAINPDVTIIRCGGHFPGSSVLYWNANGGVLLTGDTIYVVQDRRYVSFMYSYPNLIPLPPSDVRSIVASLEPFEFDRLYGSWIDRFVASDAKAAVKRSADRYIAHITE
ncbi:MAG: MBL fold metallo-hydrolase [Anaerolineae bacterium]|nr:MBL fold metallo-hydrolase [Anaerolineae bacterium]